MIILATAKQMEQIKNDPKFKNLKEGSNILLLDNLRESQTAKILEYLGETEHYKLTKDGWVKQ